MVKFLAPVVLIGLLLTGCTYESNKHSVDVREVLYNKCLKETEDTLRIKYGQPYMAANQSEVRQEIVQACVRHK